MKLIKLLSSLFLLFLITSSFNLNGGVLEGSWIITKVIFLEPQTDASSKRKYLGKSIRIENNKLKCPHLYDCYRDIPFKCLKQLNIKKDDSISESFPGSEMLCDTNSLSYSCYMGEKFAKIIGAKGDNVHCYYYYSDDDDSRRYIIGFEKKGLIFFSIPDLSIAFILKAINTK